MSTNENAFSEKRFSTKLKQDVFQFYASHESTSKTNSQNQFDAISQDQCRRMLRDFRLSPGLLTRREVNKTFFSKYRSDMVFSATIKYNEWISLLKSKFKIPALFLWVGWTLFLAMLMGGQRHEKQRITNKE